MKKDKGKGRDVQAPPKSPEVMVEKDDFTDEAMPSDYIEYSPTVATVGDRIESEPHCPCYRASSDC